MAMAWVWTGMVGLSLIFGLVNGTIAEVSAAAMEGAAAAVEGARHTEEIVARMGRAGTAGERSLGHPDAGAYALGVIFSELAEKLS